MKTISCHNPQSGFAIGTILLAVILIAAIVSAIAVSSRGSVGNANRERATIDQAAMQTTMISIDQGVERMIASGEDGASIDVNDLTQAGLMSSDRIQNAQMFAYPVGSVVPSTAFVTGQINLGTSISNGFNARIVAIYGLTDTSCQGMNQNTYDPTRLEVLRTTNFSPQFLNSQSRMAAANSYNIIFDDGVRRWVAGEIIPSSIGTPILADMDPTVIPMFNGRPVCFRFFNNNTPGGYFNTVFMWSYN